MSNSLVEAAARAAFEAAERPEILGDAPAEMSLVLADDALVQTSTATTATRISRPTSFLSRYWMTWTIPMMSWRAKRECLY